MHVELNFKYFFLCHPIYLNFEDKRVSIMVKNGDALIAYVENKRKEGKCYLFFDEVQFLEE